MTATRWARTAMPRLLFAAAALAAVCASLAPAAAETLILSLSTHRVAITSTYTGSSIVVFGAIERDERTVARAAPYDVVITVRGPRRTTIVREKERVGPLWLNTSQRRFVDLPTYLAVLSSRPIDEIAGGAFLTRSRLGLDMQIAPPGMEPRARAAPGREALLRLKNDQGLFTEEPRGVTFLTPSIFRAPITLPAVAPTGNYDVEVALFVDGAQLARQTTNFEVVKTGFEQATVTLAHDHAIFYGLGVVAMAVLFGWLATIIFRRD